MRRVAWLMMAAIIGWAFVSNAEAVTVRLSSSAEVSAAAVRLKDIGAVINCPAPLKKVMEDLVVANAPAGAEKVRVTAAEVRQRLFAAGMNMAEVVMTGASEVEVRRLAEAPKPEKQVPVADAVTEMIRDFVSKQTGISRERISVKVSSRGAVEVPASASLKVMNKSAVKVPGEAAFEVTASCGEGDVRRFDVTAALKTSRSVVVAKRTLVAGSVIREADVELKMLESDLIEGGAFEEIQAVVGEKVGRRVQAGDTLGADDLVKATLVKRGDICTVVVRGKGFHIITKARACDRGAAGDEVRLENLETKKVFTAVVVGSRRVEVKPDMEESGCAQTSASSPG